MQKDYIDYNRNQYLTKFGLTTLTDRYLSLKPDSLTEKEDPQEMFGRVASTYADNKEHEIRLYNYISNFWFMPATPVLTNAGTNRGLPISCFLNEVQDNIDGFALTTYENIYLASGGGGIGTNWSNMRSIGEKITNKGVSSGIVPFIKTADVMSLAVSQGAIRRGSSAQYLHISHPEIEEFIDLRRPTGDANRKSLNIHHGVVIPDEFMDKVEKGEMWQLKSPKTGKVISEVSARELWIKLLTTRVETGEPYLLFIDNVNKYTPEHHKKLGLNVKTSNLCVAPETLIFVRNLGYVKIQSVVNQEIETWNGFEWSLVIPRKTGENQKLLTVELNFGGKNGYFNSLECTEYHKWYIQKEHGVTCVTTNELQVGDKIIEYNDRNGLTILQGVIVSIKDKGRISDTYCFTEPKRNMAVFNGILTGNCSEITLPTGIDHLGKERTAVCCLSSVNLIHYKDWEKDINFIPDVMRFLDNVLEDFIKKAPNQIERARYSAMRERSVGLGVMGFHSFLQSQNIPFEGVMAKSWNKRIFKHLKQECDKISQELAIEKGACPDASEVGMMERFSYKIAIAPTANISNICGETSPGIEPSAANAFTQKTLSGSFKIRNKYLTILLQSKNKDTEDVWSSITTNEGSVQHLDFLTPQEKAVFKTAFEIDQSWIIEHAADRTPFVCQAQSVNLFFHGDVSKKILNAVHFSAWKKGVKSLYYCRSMSVQRPQTVSQNVKTNDLNIEAGKYEECLACQ
jgi:ribonucleotide reductase alpha subunit